MHPLICISILSDTSKKINFPPTKNREASWTSLLFFIFFIGVKNLIFYDYFPLTTRLSWISRVGINASPTIFRIYIFVRESLMSKT